MKKVGLFLLAVVMVAGYAGCGGGDDDGPPDECIAYCQSSCQKFADCKYFPNDSVSICVDACVDELDNQNLDDEEACVEATAVFNTFTCNQLGDLVDIYSSAADFGSKIARSCSQ